MMVVVMAAAAEERHGQEAGHAEECEGKEQVKHRVRSISGMVGGIIANYCMHG
jgi:hypothetical protein